MSSISAALSLDRTNRSSSESLRDHVVRTQGHHFVFTDVQAQLTIQTEATDFAQPVSVVIVELLGEQRASLLQLRRVARTQIADKFATEASSWLAVLSSRKCVED